MIRKLVATVLYASLAAGSFALGFGSSRQASATTYSLELRVMGGAASPEYTDPYDNMNCGWHGACGATPTPGWALDWKAYSGNHLIYFRGFGYRNSGSLETLARGTVEEDTTQTCKMTWIHIASPVGGTYRGSVLYEHTDTSASGNTIDIGFSTSGAWTGSNFGTTATDEKTNCKNQGLWSGEHLHQRAYWEADNGVTEDRNTATYPTYVNPGRYYVDVSSYWPDRATWSVTQ